MNARDRKPPPDLFGPMPEVGTAKVCQFCHEAVTLEQAPSGWHYWSAAGDPVDGGRHCLGGSWAGNIHLPAVRTLHYPEPVSDDERWAWRYTPEGDGRSA